MFLSRQSPRFASSHGGSAAPSIPWLEIVSCCGLVFPALLAHVWPGSGREPITSVQSIRQSERPSNKPATVDSERSASWVARKRFASFWAKSWSCWPIVDLLLAEIQGLGGQKKMAAGRQYESFQLLCQNIDAILMLLDGQVLDYRRLNVCYSAQMFGVGKTLGDKFLSQINSEDFEDYARKMISKRSQKRQKDWMAEWQRAKEARQLYVDARGRRTVDEVLDVIQQEGNIATLESSGSVTIASQRPDRALFVHIDELGELGNDVSLIRNGVIATWQSMNRERRREKEMPRIYFFLSGKGIPVGAISKWTSAVGTREILLDHLHQESVRDQQTRES